jgi:hypothetical protein
MRFFEQTGELSLQTKKGKPFIAKATVAGRGNHSGERVIFFLQEQIWRITSKIQSKLDY